MQSGAAHLVNNDTGDITEVIIIVTVQSPQQDPSGAVCQPGRRTLP